MLSVHLPSRLSRQPYKLEHSSVTRGNQRAAVKFGRSADPSLLRRRNRCLPIRRAGGTDQEERRRSERWLPRYDSLSCVTFVSRSKPLTARGPSPASTPPFDPCRPTATTISPGRRSSNESSTLSRATLRSIRPR